ncbi:hypothetical protein GCM10009747_31540 [Agromyces humatus]|uniref:Uncharacterized protein n=1 Tax=Agromyces humatus TaxID=279573 RepID=A0ABP4X5J6_9MICO
MGKKRKKPRPPAPATQAESYEQMAAELVARGLASPLILDSPGRRRRDVRPDDTA